MTPRAQAVAAALSRLDPNTHARATDILRRLGHGEMQSGLYGWSAGVEELERLGMPGAGRLVESERREVVG